MLEEVRRIKEINGGKGFHPDSEKPCSCEKCKDMCRTPCIGTPLDIEAIIDAGYAHKLAETKWLVGTLFANEPPIEMIQPLSENGWCSFRKADGLCELHNLGLKPTEGVLTSCRNKDIEYKDSVLRTVAHEWVKKENFFDIMRVVFKFTMKREICI